MDHENILKLEEVYEEDDLVYLVMPYLEKGDLFDLLEKR
jgi:serine/threonine protein kinase